MFALILTYSRAGLLVLLLPLGLACGILAATLLGVRLGREPQLAGAVPTAVRPAPASDPAIDFGVVLQYNIFNPAARSTAPVVFSLQAGEGTTVRGDLELLGTVVAGDRSLAIIRMNGEVRNYRLDVEIPGGRIEEILRNQVSIRNNDRSRTVLRLHKEESAGEEAAQRGGDTREAARVRAETSLSSAPPAGQVPAAGSAKVGADAVRSVGDNRWVVARNAAEAARGNVGAQLRTALIQPNLVNGKTDGFMIRRIQPGSLLSQMGLRQGDIIKQVNGMPLDSPEKALQIMQQLREARQITVDLKRGGSTQSFAYEIE